MDEKKEKVTLQRDGDKGHIHIPLQFKKRGGRKEIIMPDGYVWKGGGPLGESANEDHYCYGEEVYAVADGTVADTKDEIPDNVPGVIPESTAEKAGGNYIILDIGGGNYAFYAHLQPGSLKVGIGDTVKRGDVLGLLGNSGNSDGPHLHFHLCSSSSFFYSQGLPYKFDSYEYMGDSGGYAAIFENGGTWMPLGQEIAVENEMFAMDYVLSFP